MAVREFQETQVGVKVKSPGRTVTETDLVTFCQLAWNNASLHNDKLWIKKHTNFPDRVVPGLLVMAMAIGLDAQTGAYEGHSGALLGFDNVRFLASVFPNDNLRVETEIAEKRLTSDGKREVVSIKYTVFNQDEKVVAEFNRNMLWNAKARE
ncbi:MAG: MaoC family dehydratase N-terminal domain-containing protein [Chloroflexi bacterium]|nr:MaoC family dehydratase N-terminal domain-containing protein [Chloroflexota bacterium]